MFVMENGKTSKSSNGKSIQIFDISSHLSTLIHVGITPATPTPTSSSEDERKIQRSNLRQVRKKSKTLRAIEMNNRSVLGRRWRKISAEFTNQDENIKNFCKDDKKLSDLLSPRSQFIYDDANKSWTSQVFEKPELKDLNNESSKNPLSFEKDQTEKGLKDSSTEMIFRISKSDLEETIKQYCTNSSIHGLKYVGDTQLSLLERIFWVLSFLLAVCGAATFIWHLHDKYIRAPIIISRDPENVSTRKFPFPAVTICNMNRAIKSEANRINSGIDEVDKMFLEDICDLDNITGFDEVDDEYTEWENVLHFLLNVSQPCRDMLYFCKWQSNVSKCIDIFNPILTDEGRCCTFNSLPGDRIYYNPRIWSQLQITPASSNLVDWTPEYKYDKYDPADAIPWRSFGVGVNYGLTLSLDVEESQYYCSSTASVGFKMLLHSPVETPRIKDFGFILSPGKETRVIITPQITEGDLSIKSIDPKLRKCYFLQEKQLKYYRTYTQRNCLLECEADFMYKMCNCVQYYMPVSSEIKICGKKEDICASNVKKALVASYVFEDDLVNGINVSEIPNCDCYPGCYEINYSTEISQSSLVPSFDINNAYIKHNRSYFARNMAVVHIFFTDSKYAKYMKNELYGFAELLSNTGGLLGLFMGFSLLSVTEIFYFFTVRLWWRIYGKKNESDKDQNVIFFKTRPKDSSSLYSFSQ